MLTKWPDKKGGGEGSFACQPQSLSLSLSQSLSQSLSLSLALAIWAGLALLLACGKAEPLSRQPSESLCRHCNMTVVDMRFHTQALSSGGRHIDFDSIECAIDWIVEDDPEARALWTRNHADAKEWLTIMEREAPESSDGPRRAKALLLQSRRIPSPMAGGLAAYGSLDELEAARRRYGGQRKEWPQLVWEYQKKRTAGHSAHGAMREDW